MNPTPSLLSTPPPPPLRSHWQRVALPVQLLALILTIMLLGSVRCERKQVRSEARAARAGTQTVAASFAPVAAAAVPCASGHGAAASIG